MLPKDLITLWRNYLKDWEHSRMSANPNPNPNYEQNLTELKDVITVRSPSDKENSPVLIWRLWSKKIGWKCGKTKKKKIRLLCYRGLAEIQETLVEKPCRDPFLSLSDDLPTQHTTRSQPHDTLSSTYIIVAPFVVLVFGLYVDGKLGQEGALEGTEKTFVLTAVTLSGDNYIAEVWTTFHHTGRKKGMRCETECVPLTSVFYGPNQMSNNDYSLTV